MKKNKHDYDLIIIGAGPAGLAVAGFGLKNNLKTLLVEKNSCEGGECVHEGCIPTKTMLHVAKTYNDAKSGGHLGIKSSALGYNFPSIIKWRNLAVENTGVCDMRKSLEEQGLEVKLGQMEFASANSIKLNDEQLTFGNLIISTGGSAFVPEIEGLNEVGYLTYNQATKIAKVPRSLLIIGGSAIGCEFAQLFLNLGSKVSIVERSDYLINNADVQASDLLGRIYQDAGVNVFTSSKINRIEKSGTKKKIRLTDKEGIDTELMVDEIIVASGKKPNLNLGLEQAKIEYTEKGIEVDDNLLTTNPKVFAVGDVTGPMRFTHSAIYQAEMAVYNIVHPRHKKAANYDTIAWNIFTDPELASVGITEQKAISANYNYKVGYCDIVEIARADTNGEQNGFVKIIADKKTGRILGATIMAERAGEMIHELSLAMKYDISVSQIAALVHVFPTWSEAIRLAAHRAQS